MARDESPPRDEPDALARLAFSELGRAVGGIAGMHRAIADRAFAALGSAARPAQVAHDAISGGVYEAVRGGAGLAGRGVSWLVARELRRDGRLLSETARGAVPLAVLNGLIGDQLEREGSELSQPLGIRLDGQLVAVTADALADAFPAPRPRLVVFLHGLMETEHAWRYGGHETYGERLAHDLGVTAIDVRYNTGRHVSENGRDLAGLLERVVVAWPVEVEEIALVGHSMGGLVARSACHAATDDRPTIASRDASLDDAQPDRGAAVRDAFAHDASARDASFGRVAGAVRGAWVDRVRHLISLGSPHLGAPLAQGVHWLTAALDAVPETRSFGGFLRRRSAGIRDLRHGSLVDEDWRDQDPDALRARACTEVPLLSGATHYFVAATISASPRHPLGRLLGDALVLEPSASGRGRIRRIPFRDEHGMRLGGTHHLALLNHPAVYEQFHDWLSSPSG